MGYRDMDTDKDGQGSPSWMIKSLRIGAALGLAAGLTLVGPGCDSGSSGNESGQTESEQTNGADEDKADKAGGGDEAESSGQGDQKAAGGESGGDESDDSTSDDSAAGTAEREEGAGAEDSGGPKPWEPEAGDSEKTPVGELSDGTDAQMKLLQKAKEAFMANRPADARPHFEELTETGPFSGPQASAYIALGQLYIDNGEEKKAVELLSGVPEKGNKIVELRLIRARAHAGLKNFEKAIVEYETLIRMQPSYVFAYPALGQLYAEAGKEEKAGQLYMAYESKVHSMAATLEDPENSKPFERVNILDVFSVLEDERAQQAVLTALEDPEYPVRAKAARTAGQMGLKDAKSTLQEMAKNDENQEVRMAAKRALAMVEQGGTQGAPMP